MYFFSITQIRLYNMGRGEGSTNQRHSQGEEPGINEKVVSTNLDDVQKQCGDRQQDTLGHNKLLYSILEEEPYRLSRTQDNSKTTKDTIRMCASGAGTLSAVSPVALLNKFLKPESILCFSKGCVPAD